MLLLGAVRGRGIPTGICQAGWICQIPFFNLLKNSLATAREKESSCKYHTASTTRCVSYGKYKTGSTTSYNEDARYKSDNKMRVIVKRMYALARRVPFSLFPFRKLTNVEAKRRTDTKVNVKMIVDIIV